MLGLYSHSDAFLSEGWVRFFAVICLLAGATITLGACSEKEAVNPVDGHTPPVDLLKLVSISPQHSIFSDTAMPVTFKVSFNRNIEVDRVSFSMTPHLQVRTIVHQDALVFVTLYKMERFRVYTQHLKFRVLDSLGNLLSIDTVWSLRIISSDTVPPIINAVSPFGESQTGIASLRSEVVFNEPIVASNVSFDFTPIVEGDISLTDSSIVFSPKIGFLDGVNYVGRLSVIVDDTSRNQSIIDTTWTFSIARESAVYVTPNGSGDGSVGSPFGSIQGALDFVATNPSIDRVKVAVGEYVGSLILTNGVEIIGGFDNATWRLAPMGQTVIRGTQIDGVAIGVLIKDVSFPVKLTNLSIVGSDAINPGASSYGLYCFNSAAVTLRATEISSGMGASGDSGTVFNKSLGGHGGFGSYDDGSIYVDPNTGWQSWRPDVKPSTPGDRGSCADGTQNGGSVDGGNGQAGVHTFPILADILVAIATNYDLLSSNAELSGCGGGGGHGGSAGTPGHSTGGRPGGNGGTGGYGGQGGGSSISIFAVNTNVIASNSTLIAVNSGQGGSGTNSTEGFCDFYIACNGQPGGQGGGGAGGSSIGILAYGSPPTLGANVTFQLGNPGLGGASAGNPGENGVSIDTLTVK